MCGACVDCGWLRGRENKEMKAQQAKSSVDQGKGVRSDKSIKNKAERDRYVITIQPLPCKEYLYFLSFGIY